MSYDQRVYLRVKIKSLAEEARIIRREEQRSKLWGAGLTNHRKFVVRPEARNAQLAYGFLRGRTYEQLENSTKTAPDWDKVRALVAKYGIKQSPDTSFTAYKALLKEQSARFEEWIPR